MNYPFWRKSPTLWGKCIHWLATFWNWLKVFWRFNKKDAWYLSSIALFHSLRAPSMSLFLSTKVAPRSSKASILSWSRSTLTSSRLTRGSHLLADQLALPDQVLHDVQVTCANNLFLSILNNFTARYFCLWRREMSSLFSHKMKPHVCKLCSAEKRECEKIWLDRRIWKYFG